MAKPNSDTTSIADQPKVTVRLYLNSEYRNKLEAAKKAGEPVEWPTHTVQINGEVFNVEKGVDVEVPQPVAEILEQAGLI